MHGDCIVVHVSIVPQGNDAMPQDFDLGFASLAVGRYRVKHSQSMFLFYNCVWNDIVFYSLPNPKVKQ